MQFCDKCASGHAVAIDAYMAINVYSDCVVSYALHLVPILISVLRYILQ